MMRFIRAFLMFLARLCLAAVFLWGGVGKWLYYDQTVQYMASKGFTMIPLFLTGASLVEILGALSLIFGYRSRLGATLLLLFLIPTTAIFHDFWNLTGTDQSMQLIHFLKNLAIFGGLLYVACIGSGYFACDSTKNHSKNPEPIKAKAPEGPNNIQNPKRELPN